MTADFILERLEVIGSSAHEKELGTETGDRMLKYLASHRSGNEEAIKAALHQWRSCDVEFKRWLAGYLFEKLAFDTDEKA